MTTMTGLQGNQGSGKVAEVTQAIDALNVDTVIFDDELSPGQLRNLEKAFSGGSKGRQVELAQTEYQLPRLTRMWTHLDRVSGGGQVKGAGEKQIEIDKRLLRDKAAALRRELQAVRTHRAAHRARRSSAPIPVVALVGYTNAGKSTLLNTLTAAGVLAEDLLFATLDPTTRKVRLEGNLEVLFSDTVGFIQKLPTQLVAAFRATLEEIAAASVVLHVLDASAPNAAAQCAAVLQVDACPDPAAVKALAASRSDTVAISGATGEGMTELLEAIAAKLAEGMAEMQVLLPYSAGGLLDDLHKMGKVDEVHYTEQGVQVTARVPRCLVGKLAPYSNLYKSSSSSSSRAPAGDRYVERFPGEGSADLCSGSVVDDGDNGQLTAFDCDTYDLADFDVDNPSFEELAAAGGVGPGRSAFNSSWDDSGDDRSVSAAANGLEHNSHKASYRPQVAGSRAGKRAAKQQQQRQQASLSQHQLPPDWLELLTPQESSSSR
eukprot:gene12176-12313_t